MTNYNHNMVVSVISSPSQGVRMKHVLLHQCDTCGSNFKTKYAVRRLKFASSYCSKECLGRGRSKDGPSGVRLTNSMMKKHGVPFAVFLPQCEENRARRSFALYGVEHPLQALNIRELGRSSTSEIKKHETRKRNGSYRTSKQERRMYEHLCTKFGEEDVERFKPINRWPIDCYVRSIDTYYQYDGDYWHGHDRPLETILKFEKSRDKIIYKKMLTDAKQNEWFAARGMKLIRVIGLDGLKRLIDAG